MSLINDALKRAKETPPPPTPNLPLRPAEPPTPAGNGLRPLMTAFWAAVAVVAVILIWELTRERPTNASDQLTAQARSPEASVSAPTPGSANVPGAEAPKATPTALGSSGGAAPGTNSFAPNSPATNSGPSPTQTNTTVVAEPPPESPPPLKLQGIVYSPSRPSALISGRTLFIGDRIRDSRVIGISPSTATLWNGEQKTVLTLDH